MKKFEYYKPKNLKEAFKLMERFQGAARYIAGGTDLIIRIRQKILQPDALISLRNIESLKIIRHNGGLSLGSMSLIRDMERYPGIARDYPALAQAASVLASPQIRNVATVGGNLCNSSPCADSAPPLLVTGAKVVLEGPGGIREIPLDEFFTGPGENCMDPTEVMKSIEVPEQVRGTGMAFLKIGRVAQDLAVTSVAALVVMDGDLCRKCRLAAGSVAPVSLRLKNVEKFIEGQKINDDLLKEAAKMVEKEVSPITDVRSTEEYRRVATGVLVKRAIRKALERG